MGERVLQAASAAGGGGSTMGDNILTIVLAVIAATAASVVTGLFTRPKVTAEAAASQAGKEVALSGDAREWAKVMADRAQRAEDKAERCSQRVGELEEKLARLESYNRQLIHQIVRTGHVPDEPQFDFYPMPD